MKKALENSKNAGKFSNKIKTTKKKRSGCQTFSPRQPNDYRKIKEEQKPSITDAFRPYIRIKGNIGLQNAQIESKSQIAHPYKNSSCKNEIQDQQLKPRQKAQKEYFANLENVLCRICFQENCQLHSSIEKPQLPFARTLVNKDSLTENETSSRGEGKITRKDFDAILSLLTIYYGDSSAVSRIFNGKYSKLLIDKIGCKFLHSTKVLSLDPKPYNLPAFKISQSSSINHIFRPCVHPNEDCTLENCTCMQNSTFCELSCQCVLTNCKNYFSGCSCRSRKCLTNACPCKAARRGCNSALCKHCVDDNEDNCQNFALQNCHYSPRPKLYIAPTKISGFGCFAGQHIEKNQLVIEYVGEMISHEEAEVRGKICDKIRCSYIFDITKEEFSIDAQNFGNKSRFINHSALKPNIIQSIEQINGDHRILLRASRDIHIGEELLFDYMFSQASKLKHFGSTEV